MAARVVGDHAVARALERPRAHDHVAPRRGQPVQQHDRDALPRLLAGSRRRPTTATRMSTLRSLLACVGRRRGATCTYPADRRRYHRAHGRHREQLSDRGPRSLAHGAGGRRLLGRVVRAVPAARARARAGRRRARRQGRAGQGRHRRQPAPGRRRSGSRASRPSRRSGTAQVAAEFVGAQPPAAVERFLDSLLPSEADGARRSTATRRRCGARSSSSRAAPTPPFRWRGSSRTAARSTRR